MAIKVFIVDDHYMVIEGIRSLLQHEASIDWMGHATNSSSCMAFLQQQIPDVILMDINLPDASGIELCREVKEKYPVINVLGLSTFNRQSFVEKMLANGASGYVVKNATGEELIDAIHTVVKGNKYLSFDAALALRRPDTGKPVPVLTRREVEVLSLIAEGLTNNEIGHKLFISHTTVDSHRKSLLSKLAAKNTAALVKTAMEFKLI